mmetsp:Transcript_57261/g.163158  ORF Transcript_57261/g.163158 Transcript_57261/m.163158 type:complete len:300 (+) Transcript_57261:234-1133(+)
MDHAIVGRALGRLGHADGHGGRIATGHVERQADRRVRHPRRRQALRQPVHAEAAQPRVLERRRLGRPELPPAPVDPVRGRRPLAGVPPAVPDDHHRGAVPVLLRGAPGLLDAPRHERVGAAAGGGAGLAQRAGGVQVDAAYRVRRRGGAGREPAADGALAETRRDAASQSQPQLPRRLDAGQVHVLGGRHTPLQRTHAGSRARERHDRRRFPREHAQPVWGRNGDGALPCLLHGRSHAAAPASPGLQGEQRLRLVGSISCPRAGLHCSVRHYWSRGLAGDGRRVRRAHVQGLEVLRGFR